MAQLTEGEFTDVVLKMIRAKLKADGIDESDDDAVRECLGRCAMPKTLRRVWTLYKTVTKLETDPFFAVTVCNDFREVRHREHSMETISCVIEPIDSQSCRVIWTLALMAVGVHHKIRTALCYCRLANALEKHAQAYMKCFSDEAVRRRAKEIPE